MAASVPCRIQIAFEPFRHVDARHRLSRLGEMSGDGPRGPHGSRPGPADEQVMRRFRPPQSRLHLRHEARVNGHVRKLRPFHKHRGTAQFRQIRYADKTPFCLRPDIDENGFGIVAQ